MIRLLHLYPRLALTFGALLIPMAFVCASAYADSSAVQAAFNQQSPSRERCASSAGELLKSMRSSLPAPSSS